MTSIERAVIICILLVLLCVGYVAFARYAAPRTFELACEYYSHLTINEVPARCLKEFR